MIRYGVKVMIPKSMAWYGMMILLGRVTIWIIIGWGMIERCLIIIMVVWVGVGMVWEE